MTPPTRVALTRQAKAPEVTATAHALERDVPARHWRRVGPGSCVPCPSALLASSRFSPRAVPRTPSVAGRNCPWVRRAGEEERGRKRPGRWSREMDLVDDDARLTAYLDALGRLRRVGGRGRP